MLPILRSGAVVTTARVLCLTHKVCVRLAVPAWVGGVTMSRRSARRVYDKFTIFCFTSSPVARQISHTLLEICYRPTNRPAANR
jgi:hypothetical protein